MFKALRLTAITIIITCIYSFAFAQIEVVEISDSVDKRIFATGFIEYPPFGEKTAKKNGYIIGAMAKFIEKDLARYKFKVHYAADEGYEELVSLVRRGQGVDILYGMYSQTKIYEGIDIVYPAIASNPITIITLPSRTEEIKSLEDVLNLKGAVSSKEILSDHVNREMKRLNVEFIDDSYELYEKLFKGEIDYIFSGYYFGLIETSKIGIRKKVSFSKQTIWNIPIFYGVSKGSNYREQLMHIVERAVENPMAKRDMEKLIVEEVTRIERDNLGVVPPTFVVDAEKTKVE